MAKGGMHGKGVGGMCGEGGMHGKGVCVAGGSMSKRYASYWNAFLLRKSFGFVPQSVKLKLKTSY